MGEKMTKPNDRFEHDDGMNEPIWPALDPESGDFTDGWNQAIDLCKQAFEKWRGAVQGTPQVEDSLELTEALEDVSAIAQDIYMHGNYSQRLIAALKIIRKHLPGAPAQPGPEEMK